MVFQHTHNTKTWATTFEKYRALRKESTKTSLEKRGQSLAFSLYKVAKQHTPTPEFLMSLPPLVGWRIRRSAGWAVYTIRGEPTKRSRLITKVHKDGSIRERIVTRTTREIVKPGEMERRVKSLGVTARGWVPRIFRFVRGFNRVKRPLGRIELSLAGGVATVTITNSMPGAAVMEAKYGVVSKAFQLEEADMQAYIEKQEAKIMQNAGMEVSK